MFVFVNNPYVVGPEGVGGGNTDEAKAIEMARRAKALRYESSCRFSLQ